MRILRSISGLFFISCLAFFESCDNDDQAIKPIYLEGEPIEGIEINFPLGFYGADPLMPKISPDGKKLLFTGPVNLPEWRGLWIMDLKTHQRIFLHDDGRNADWSPDSEWIVFNIEKQIYKIRKDGSDLTQLTFDGWNVLPDWSPSGDLIIYDNSSCGSASAPAPANSCGVLTMDVAGTYKQFILSSAPMLPKWFPSGDKFLTGGGQVFNLNGENIQTIPVTQGFRGMDINMTDERIAASSDNGISIITNLDIKIIIPNHLYNPEYQGEKKLFTAQPSWYPDGKNIVYEHFEITKTKQFQSEIHVEGIIRFYKVNADSAISRSNL